VGCCAVDSFIEDCCTLAIGLEGDDIEDRAVEPQYQRRPVIDLGELLGSPGRSVLRHPEGQAHAACNAVPGAGATAARVVLIAKPSCPQAEAPCLTPEGSAA
jgi:hypothetical protein